MKNKLKSCVFFFVTNQHKKNISNKKEYTNKVVPINILTNNELTNIQLLKNITNYTNFFYVPIQINSTSIGTLEEDDRHLISAKFVSETNTSFLFKYEKRELIYFKTYLKKTGHSGPKKYIVSLIDSYQHILQSINLINKINIIHNNINFDSILIDKFDIPLLTDFRVSINKNNSKILYKLFDTYEPSYIYRAPEIHLISYMITNNIKSLSSYNIEYVLNDITKYTLLSKFGKNMVDENIADGVKYFSKYINRSIDYVIADILEHNGNTWDNYSLSILFLKIFTNLHNILTNKSNKFIILFMKLLVINIHYNPTKRQSIDFTINTFSDLLKEISLTDYKDLIDDLSSK